MYEEFGASIQFGLVSQRLVANLVDSIRRVGNKLTEENFLVAVESIDDEAHQLVNFSLEGKSLSVRLWHFGVYSVVLLGACPVPL
jgi:hypothetical protein